MIAVTEMTSFEELANLRMTWKQLWEKSRGASFVHSWEWLRSYWRLFGEGLQLRTLVVTLNAKPIGIVPFVLRPVTTKLGTANVLTWPLEDWSMSYAAIGPNPAATLTSAMRHITKSRDWNAIELSGIDEQGLDRGRTRNALRNSGIDPVESGRHEHPAIQLEGSWDWYLEAQGADSRRTLARAEHQLERHGPVSFHRWRPMGGRVGETERRWDLFHSFEEIRRASTAKSSQVTNELAFLKDLHPQAVDCGAVDICTLTVSGRPVACSYSYVTNGNVEVLYAGATEPAGTPAREVLIGNLIRDSFARDDQRITFRPEQAASFPTWTNGSVTTITLSHVPKLSPRGQLLKLGRRAQPSLAPAPSLSVSGKSAAVTGGLAVYAGT